MKRTTDLTPKAFLAFSLAIASIISGCTKDEPTSPVTTCPVCTNPLVDSSANVLVTSVTDGDTFGFLVKGEEFKVRVLDIDCFETRHGSRLDSQAVKAKISIDSALSLGFKAKALADSLLNGKEVLIVRDSVEPDLDVYGRVLRRVFMKGNVNYAEFLRARGLVAPE